MFQGLLGYLGDVTKVTCLGTFSLEAGSGVETLLREQGVMCTWGRGVGTGDGRWTGGGESGRRPCCCLTLRRQCCQVLGAFRVFNFRKSFADEGPRKNKGLCAVGESPASCRECSVL